MRLLLVGENAAGIRMLRALTRSPHEVVAVMTSPPATRGPAGLGTVWSVAKALGCATWPAELVREPGFAETVRQERVDVLLNVHSLHRIHETVLAATVVGAFNVHPGFLPEYAGLNTVSWAIYQGEAECGVTIHWMDAEVDAGPIAFEAACPLEEGDTPVTVMGKCVTAGVALGLRLLSTAASDPGAIPRRAQDPSRRRYFGRDVPEEGRLRWTKSARAVANFVRACDYHPFRSPWGHPRTRVKDREIEVLTVARTGLSVHDEFPGTVGECCGADVYVACADEWVVVRRIRVDGRAIAPSEALRSGDRLREAG